MAIAALGGPGRGRRRGRVAFAAAAAGGALLFAILTAVGSHHEAAGGDARGAPVQAGSPSGQRAARRGLPTVGRAQVVETDDVGDPFVLAASPTATSAAEYVLYWTTDWQSNVPTAVSTDLVHWNRVADSLPVLPTWAEPSLTKTWGPTVHRVGNQWVLYYSTEVAASHLECIGRGVASTPTGPFKDASPGPMVCQASLGGNIDPSVVTDASGASSLLWKNDGNAVGRPVGIWEQGLSPDGLSVVGAPTRLLGADQAWEHDIIEGPAMLAASKGGWWLFYSGGTWQSNTYDTGVAWCATVSGPCRKPVDAPLLTSVPTAVSPGGFDTFVDAHGTRWASYSAFPEAPANPDAAMAENRVLEIAPVLSW